MDSTAVYKISSSDDDEDDVQIVEVSGTIPKPLPNPIQEEHAIIPELKLLMTIMNSGRDVTEDYTQFYDMAKEFYPHLQDQIILSAWKRVMKTRIKKMMKESGLTSEFFEPQLRMSDSSSEDNSSENCFIQPLISGSSSKSFQAPSFVSPNCSQSFVPPLDLSARSSMVSNQESPSIVDLQDEDSDLEISVVYDSSTSNVIINESCNPQYLKPPTEKQQTTTSKGKQEPMIKKRRRKTTAKRTQKTLPAKSTQNIKENRLPTLNNTNISQACTRSSHTVTKNDASYSRGKNLKCTSNEIEKKPIKLPAHSTKAQIKLNKKKLKSKLEIYESKIGQLSKSAYKRFMAEQNKLIILEEQNMEIQKLQKVYQRLVDVLKPNCIDKCN